MKRFLLVLAGIFVAYLSWSASLVTSDTIPSDGDPEPKIIYYQSDNDRSEKKSSYNRWSSRRRGGGRVKTLAGSMNHSGGFGAITFKTTDFREEAMVFGGLRGGWIINRTLALGAEAYGVIPTARFEDIETGADAVALGGYGGMFLELIFFSNEVIHITFPMGAGAGWLGFERRYSEDIIPNNNAMYEGQIIDDDVFWYIEPGANAELNVARNFRLAFGVSKRYTQDFDLVYTDGQALQKLNYYVTLKIGSF